MKNKKWLIWGLISFTAILLVTAVVLFLQLRQPVPTALPSPKPKPSPATPPVQQTTTENVCQLSFTVSELKCTGITLEPTGTGIGSGDVRKLTAQVTGGSGSYTHNWTIDSSGNDGSLTSTTTNPTTWTAPGSLNSSSTQEWVIKDTIRDNSTTQQTADCQVTFNFGGLNSCFDTCGSDSDCESDLRCLTVGGTKRCVNPACSEDTDCTCASPNPSASPQAQASASPVVLAQAQPSASPRVEQPKLPEAGVNTPMVLGVSAGVLMMLAGLLWL